MLWGCPTFPKAVLASHPQLGSPARCPVPARTTACPGPHSRCHQRWARRAGSPGQHWGGTGEALGRHWGSTGRTGAPPRFPTVPARCGCPGAPLMPSAHLRSPPELRSVSPGHSRPSRSPLAPGALYHAVRGGWPSPSRHRAVTEPGCRLSTHLMSEQLRCRQPRSRHRSGPARPARGAPLLAVAWL